MSILEIEGAIAFGIAALAAFRLVIRKIRTDKMEAYICAQARIHWDNICENCNKEFATCETDDTVQLCDFCYKVALGLQEDATQ